MIVKKTILPLAICMCIHFLPDLSNGLFAQRQRPDLQPEDKEQPAPDSIRKEIAKNVKIIPDEKNWYLLAGPFFLFHFDKQ